MLGSWTRLVTSVTHTDHTSHCCLLSISHTLFDPWIKPTDIHALKLCQSGHVWTLLNVLKSDLDFIFHKLSYKQILQYTYSISMATSQPLSWHRLTSEYDWAPWICNLQMDAININVWQYIDPDDSHPLKLLNYPVPPEIRHGKRVSRAGISLVEAAKPASRLQNG